MTLERARARAGSVELPSSAAVEGGTALRVIAGPWRGSARLRELAAQLSEEWRL